MREDTGIVGEAFETSARALVDACAKVVGDNPYMMEAAMKTVLRDLCHLFADRGVGSEEIAEHLDTMADVMRDKQPPFGRG